MTGPRNIAIVGLAGRFPGGSSLDGFWDLIVAGKSASRPIPANRWPVDPASMVSERGEPDRARSRHACLLETLEGEGPEFGGTTDPLTRLLIRVGVEALDSVHGDIPRDRMRAIVANIDLPTDAASAWGAQVLLGRMAQRLGTSASTEARAPAGAFPSATPVMALAEHLGLGLGGMTLDAACASSFYALELGCLELETGRADAVLAGGVALPQSIYTQVGFTQLNALSPSGVCAPFSNRADGLVVGEGCGLVVLKRLEDAERDGDAIWGVIRGIGLSNDLGGSLLSPDDEGQLRAMRAAFAQAQWEPSHVQLVECHGTGTPRGDLVELKSLETLFGTHRPMIGSVKSNVGHLLTAAGMAGLTKVLLAMRRGILPPTANVPLGTEVSQQFEMLREPREWLAMPKRAALSGFGFGGINAHVLIESVAARPKAQTRRRTLEPMAIVGVGLHAGAATSVDAFRERQLDMDALVTARPTGRWRFPSSASMPGVWIESVDFPVGQFKIPPVEIQATLPQQLLMLKVAAEALADAGGLGDVPGARKGAVIGLSLDLETTTFHLRWVLERFARETLRKLEADVEEAALRQWVQEMAARLSGPLDAPRVLGALGGIVTSRIAREFRFGGPAFGVHANDASGLCALQVAQQLLSAGHFDRAVVGAVELAGDERRVSAAQALGEDVFPVDGAVAFVVQRLSDVRSGSERVYAVIDEVNTERSDVSCIGTGAAAGMLRLAQHVLAKHHRVPKRLTGRRRDEVESPQHRALSAVPSTRLADRARLGEAPVVSPQPLLAGRRPAGLFILERSDGEELERLVRAFPHASVDTLAAEWFHRHGPKTGVATVVRSVDEILEHAAGSKVVNAAIDGELAFVFPGSGSHYHGMGETLPLSLPELENSLPTVDTAAETLGALMVRQVMHSLRVHEGLTLLGVRPQAYLGYSLGESAALFASRIWKDREVMFERTLKTPLFQSVLTKTGSLVRSALGPEAEWTVVLVMRDQSEIRRVLTGTARLLIVNAPGECVIGGSREDVRLVVGKLGGAAVFLEGVPFVHLPALTPVQEQYRDLHLLSVTPRADVRMYSAAWGRAFEVSPEACADSIVANAVGGFDFPALIDQAWRDGVRVFVEPGPQGSCTRMIGRILKGRPHVAVAACQRNEDGYVSLLEAAAAVARTGRAIDLAPLYGNATRPVAKSEHRTVRVAVGGSPIEVPPFPTGPGPTNLRPDATLQAPEVQRVEDVRSHSSQRDVTGRPSPASDPLAGVASVALLASTSRATAEAHAVFLEASRQSVVHQARLLERLRGGRYEPAQSKPFKAVAFDRAACLEFARGRISNVLGPSFASIDRQPTRVRLPDEPLMLVDRIVEVEGEMKGLGSGRCVTEHDVLPGAWYLDGGRVPVCISVEAGQADLFLSAYLGIDFETRGERVYRLLDAKVVFHRGLPVPGEVIRYDIRIDRFLRQGDTWLFFFRFDGTIAGQPFITMFDGCAGFFSDEQLTQGKGIVAEAGSAKSPPSEPFRRLAPHGSCTLNDAQVEALRKGDLTAAFPDVHFPVRTLAPALRLPGGRMRLVDRVVQLETSGGENGFGLAVGEHDVTPDAWFLTCHFGDDPVMPGTLMYECCLHTLRILLIRLGFVSAEADDTLGFSPIEGQVSQLKCRGQVLPTTQKVQYRVEIEQLGYGPEPFVIARASMYADGKHIVQMEGMSLRIQGLSQEGLARLWASASPLFDTARIVEFCEGAPSKCFGPIYAAFDGSERRLARLPRDPFRFIDRVIAADVRPFVLEPGGWITCEYDVPRDAWYFAATEQPTIPFSVLLEIALQPCGFLAAYAGSALTTDSTLAFRNLDGHATLHEEVFRDVGTLTTRTRLTKVSRAGEMLLEEFDFEVWARGTRIYSGHTGFGFFLEAALAQQVGIRGASAWASSGSPVALRPAMDGWRFPGARYAMLDSVERCDPDGVSTGQKTVDPSEWFFQAHFFQDPVMPGSLGLEALLQLMHVVARERFPKYIATHRSQSTAVGRAHRWQYRGQVVPSNQKVEVQARVKHVEEGDRPLLVTDGQLLCDGKVIYAMQDFALRLVPRENE